MSEAEALPPLARRKSARQRSIQGRSAKGHNPLLGAAPTSPGPLRRLLARGADRGAQRPEGSDAVAVGTLDDQNDVMDALR
jgi:hypothetical protein